jgi:DNA (cytosine-5)-methyltransferase 1
LSNKKKFSLVSLFSGCGGMDLGFLGGFEFLEQNFGSHPIEVIWANELNEKACETYNNNFDHGIVQGDIWSVMDKLPKTADIVVGGFPCQDISVNNRNAQGVNGERSGLYKAMVEVVRRTNPRIFVAENVKALLNNNHKGSITKVINDFSNLGYEISYKIYNAASYGVSQTRERVMIIGTRSEEETFYHPNEILHKNDWIPVERVIGDLLDSPKDPKWSHEWSIAKNGASQGNRFLKRGRPGYTIRAECHGNTHYHYELPRRISNREGARIQSFPDDFMFASRIRDTERQIGNAVPPILAWHVAEAVVSFLNGKQKIPKETQLKLY